MTYGQPQAGDLEKVARPPGRRADPGTRVALAAAALAVVLAGVGAAVPSASRAASWDNGPWHTHVIPVGIGLEVIFVGLLVAAELHRRRRPTAGQPAAGLRALLRSFLLLGVIAIPILILIDSADHLSRPRLRPQSPPPQRRTLPRLHSHAATAHGGGSLGAAILYALIVLVLLAALVVCAILLRRRVRRGAWDDQGEIIDDEPADQLRRAVQSGQAALHGIDDARLAIIACYVAMEGSLARAGAVRAAAETPDELLVRAARAGLVQGAEAARLTGLFYEARFSSHPLPPAKREAARQALQALAVGAAARTGAPE